MAGMVEPYRGTAHPWHGDPMAHTAGSSYPSTSYEGPSHSIASHAHTKRH